MNVLILWVFFLKNVNFSFFHVMLSHGEGKDNKMAGSKIAAVEDPFQFPTVKNIVIYTRLY